MEENFPPPELHQAHGTGMLYCTYTSEEFLWKGWFITPRTGVPEQ